MICRTMHYSFYLYSSSVAKYTQYQGKVDTRFDNMTTQRTQFTLSF